MERGEQHAYSTPELDQFAGDSVLQMHTLKQQTTVTKSAHTRR